MARYIKQFDPEETHRRIAVDIQEAHCPGLLEFLSTLPFGHEGPGLRAIVYQWFLAREADGTLHDAFDAVVAGPGGLSGTRVPKTKVQGTKRASSRPVAQVIRPKRATRSAPEVAAPDISSPVHVAGGQELPPPSNAPVNVQVQSASDQNVRLQEPKEIATAPSVTAHSDVPLAQSTGEDGQVNLNKITPTQLEALMGLDKMFD
jgi:hypothetical protein